MLAQLLMRLHYLVSPTGSSIDLEEGGSFNLSAVTVTPVDSGEAILIQIRVPESFTLTEKVWDETIGDNGGFV